MTNNEIWNNSELTKRQKVVLCYQTPVELRQAQLEYWKLEAGMGGSVLFINELGEFVQHAVGTATPTIRPVFYAVIRHAMKSCGLP